MGNSWHTDKLDDFVAQVDAAGGPENSGACFVDFDLKYNTNVNVDLDPYGADYYESQISLYKEISGKNLDQNSNEMTSFDFDHHFRSANPYGIRDPSRFVLHYLRIAKAIRKAELSVNPRILDMGSGWGLTSEFFAILGASVVAIDINPKFVELVQKRASRLGLPIEPLVGSFDEFSVSGLFDLVFFYESLHHSVRPWEVIERCAANLKHNGKFALAGEPIQNAWWPHWGLRLDPLSVYCIRKFGWFESGWSRGFAVDMFRRANLEISFWDDDEPGLGPVGVASFNHDTVSFDDVLTSWLGDGWLIEPAAAISTGCASLNILPVKNNGDIVLLLNNYRGKEILGHFLSEDGSCKEDFVLQSGISEFRLNSRKWGSKVNLISEAWSPLRELGTSDDRILSIHLEKILIPNIT